jgi:integrase/DNA-directed RNA polymerase subunit M/transcription elongation factor TFIIS
MAGAEGEKADFHINAQKSRTRSSQSGLNNGKLGLPNPAAQPLNRLQPQTPKEKTEEPKILVKCPQCGSKCLYKDGLRYLGDGSSVQRWLCRNCGYRFTDPNHKAKTVWKNPPSGLNLASGLLYSCQGNDDPKGRGPSAPEAVQTLATVEKENGKRAAGATAKPSEAELHGKIVEFLWWMKKQGYRETTINGKGKRLTRLVRLGANLFDPESVKEVLATQNWFDSGKETTAYAYDLFAKYVGIKWERPTYKPPKKLPFIPIEREIDDLIAGNNSKSVATFLQIAKETGARAGEIYNLKWTDIDFERKTLMITPEKGSDPRIFKLSSKLSSMLENLPKTSQKVFSNYKSLKTLSLAFQKNRKRLAYKLGNPRLLRISFHTLRHWKATVEYHKTKDILHVMQMLGHRNIKNTLIYTQLIQHDGDDEYVCKVAKTVEQASELIEAGFDYVCEIDGVKLFRKRK